MTNLAHLRQLAGNATPKPGGWSVAQTPRRNLVKAGALILAEIERLDRLEHREPKL